ncbi:hypothetical protein BGZ95_006835, partial [Linnemannia exigua]
VRVKPSLIAADATAASQTSTILQPNLHLRPATVLFANALLSTPFDAWFTSGLPSYSRHTMERRPEPNNALLAHAGRDPPIAEHMSLLPPIQYEAHTASWATGRMA